MCASSPPSEDKIHMIKKTAKDTRDAMEFKYKYDKKVLHHCTIDTFYI